MTEKIPSPKKKHEQSWQWEGRYGGRFRAADQQPLLALGVGGSFGQVQ